MLSLPSILLLFAFHRASAHGSEAPPPPPLEAWTEKAPLVLAQGEQRLLHVPNLARYSLGSGVVHVHRFGESGSFVLKAVGPGAGDLWVWKKDGTSEHRSIRVDKAPFAALPPGLERALGSLEEAEVFLAEGGVTIRGKISTLEEASRVEALAKGYAKEVRDETDATDELLALGRARLQGWLARSAFRDRLRVEEVERELWVRGSLERAADRSAVEREARSLYPRVQLEISALPDSTPTVHFRVFLLELKRNRFHSLGLGWPEAQEGAFRVTTSGVEDLLSLDLTLQILEGDAAARLLSNPELAVRAPGEAELFAGGELPIETHNQYESTVNWKNYGLTLHLKVTHVTGELVRLEIFTEVSHLDMTAGVGKLPGIQANRMKTQVDARFGKPLLLSGLLQQGTREQARGLPWLRSLPVLGALFGSEDYLQERSELVAILLPAASPPPAPERVLRRFPRTLTEPDASHAPPPDEAKTPADEPPRELPWYWEGRTEFLGGKAEMDL